MNWPASTPFHLFEIAQVMIPLAGTLVGATTLRTSRAKYRRLMRSGINGDLRVFRWMHYRTDRFLLIVQLLFLFAGVWRAIDRDPPPECLRLYLTTGITRAVASSVVVLMVLLNNRDCARIGHSEH